MKYSELTDSAKSAATYTPEMMALNSEAIARYGAAIWHARVTLGVDCGLITKTDDSGHNWHLVTCAYPWDKELPSAIDCGACSTGDYAGADIVCTLAEHASEYAAMVASGAHGRIVLESVYCGVCANALNVCMYAQDEAINHAHDIGYWLLNYSDDMLPDFNPDGTVTK